jgi:hypothetical protein
MAAVHTLSEQRHFPEHRAGLELRRDQFPPVRRFFYPRIYCFFTPVYTVLLSRRLS